MYVLFVISCLYFTAFLTSATFWMHNANYEGGAYKVSAPRYGVY
jgi:hypothetical protein